MAEIPKLKGPAILSRAIENGVRYQVLTGSGSKAPACINIVPLDPTATSLPGSLALDFGQGSDAMDLSAGDWFREWGAGPSMFFLEASGLDPSQPFQIEFLRK